MGQNSDSSLKFNIKTLSINLLFAEKLIILRYI